MAEEQQAEDILIGDVSQVLSLPEAMDGGIARSTLEYTSRAPSESSSRPSSPSGAAPCPDRLCIQYPPANYGVAKDGMVFRSAYLRDRNLEFFECLHLKSVLCLVDTEPSIAYSLWIARHGIKRIRVDIAPNKEGKPGTTLDSLCEALLHIMDVDNYPLLVHCNQGKHRTGCVIACLRKIQRWNIDEILAEYHSYADPKARPGDIDLIRAFDPEAVFEYAKAHGYFESRSFMKRMDSTIVDVEGLAAALASNATKLSDLETLSTAGNCSSNSSDQGMEMRTAGRIELLDGGRPGFQRTDSGESMITHHGARAQGDDFAVLDPELDCPSTSVIELRDEDMTPPPDMEHKAFGKSA
ncbi:hypothetical protein LTR62_007328 [Meristemomyces frigidus]|uniref:Uncharacterized protein n=1 Tax=Meristemomyces frigidus TaxID=1508187 RepID=A0AAN7TV05_9PEZI|nr:hypothetical protein LTR62_007328 [Meristemomyces frigidus]